MQFHCAGLHLLACGTMIAAETKGLAMGRTIEFEGLRNVRDLGGIPAGDGRAVRDGLLFRSGQLASASTADLARLHELGVRLVVDFRNPHELEEKPDPVVEDARYLHLPVFSDQRAGITRDTESDMGVRRYFASGGPVDPEVATNHMCKMYRSFVEDPYSCEQYARFIGAVIETAGQGSASLWHCTVGKDRAGFGTAIVLAALGVSRDDIAADYVLTNDYIADTMDDFVATVMNVRLDVPESARVALTRIFTADPAYLQAAYEHADELYGSFDGFLEQALGLDCARRERMRELLTV